MRVGINDDIAKICRLHAIKTSFLHNEDDFLQNNRFIKVQMPQENLEILIK